MVSSTMTTIFNRYSFACAVLLLGLTLFAGNARAQIFFEALNSNPQLVPRKSGTTEKILFQPQSQNYYELDTLSLPFFDDFSVNKFKDFRTYQYTGITSRFQNYYEVDDIADPYPDSVYWVFTQPYIYSVNGGGTIDSVLSTQQVKIWVYDTILNPFQRIDSIQAWAYQPRLTLVNGVVTVRPGDFDGRFFKREKEYFIHPAQPWDRSLWADIYVYRNIHLPINPPTIGVATFDGIDEYGQPYNFQDPNSYGVADYLTSKPIDLSMYSAGDSVYLSFAYQPQGLGFYPGLQDSLVVEFREPGKPGWDYAWSVPGTQLHPFRKVMLKITQARYFKKGFQFRFKNYATLSANKDHWMVDYVYLNANRSASDTMFRDIALVSPPPTILDVYTRMPYQQFTKPDVNEKWENNQISNLWSSDVGIYYEHSFIAPGGTVLSVYPFDNLPGPYDTACVQPYAVAGYDANVRHTTPFFSYDFDVQWPGGLPFTSKQTFTVQHRVQAFNCPKGAAWTPFTDIHAENDTSFHTQVFNNYYAYDDSTAELSMYLGTQGEVTCMFETNFADTLRAIQFHFNPQSVPVTNNNFTLVVYKDDNGKPGDTLYTQSYVLPQYAMWGPHGYTTYILNRPVPVPAGKFYAGWKQNTIYKLNVGLDKNRDNADRLFYRTTGEWIAFDDLGYDGSLMLRAVVGGPVTPDEFLGTPVYETPEQITHSMLLYPNPVADRLYFRSSMAPEKMMQVEIYDIQGQQVRNHYVAGYESISVQGLKPGIYILRAVNQDEGFVQTQKFIVTQ